MLRQHTTSSEFWCEIIEFRFAFHRYRCEISLWTWQWWCVWRRRVIRWIIGAPSSHIWRFKSLNFFSRWLCCWTLLTVNATLLLLLLQSVSFFYYYFSSLSLSHAYYAIENVTFFFGRLSCAHERADNAIGRNFKFFLVRLADIKEKGAVDAVDAVQGWSALSFFSSSSSHCCSSESDVKEKNPFCLIPWGLSSFWLAVQYPHIDHTLDFRVWVAFDSLLDAARINDRV